MHRGYIKLYRKGTEHALFSKPLVWHFWQYCLLRANHKDRETIFNGKPLFIKKGSFIMSRKTASIATGLTEQNIRTAIKTLINFKMIQKSTNKLTKQATILSVCKYITYQKKTEASNQVNNQRLTSDQPATNQRLTTDKNVKELKNDKNEKNKTGFSEAFTRWWQTYPLRNGRKRGKQKAATLFEKIDSGLWNDLKKATDHYTQETESEFIKDPERFLGNDFWKGFVNPPDKQSKPSGRKSVNEKPTFRDVLERTTYHDDGTITIAEK